LKELNWQFSTTKPTTPGDLQTFAYTLGEHTKKFSGYVQYKTFVKELLEQLTKDLKPNQLNEIYIYIDRLTQQRAQEEKTGNGTYVLNQPDGDDSDDQDPAGLYDDSL
jgi:hypothetical protein